MIEQNTDTMQQNHQSEWLSISDLMSGLMVLFALLVVVTLWQLKVVQERTENTRVMVIQALQQQFNANGINAEVNPETGDITLLDSVLFDHNERELKPEGIDFLDKFIPIYTSTIFSNPDIASEISRIIIEGHTSSDGVIGYNMTLSLQRANSVFQFINNMNIVNADDLISILQVSGRGPLDASKAGIVSNDRKVIFKMQFKNDEQRMKFCHENGNSCD